MWIDKTNGRKKIKKLVSFLRKVRNIVNLYEDFIEFIQYIKNKILENPECLEWIIELLKWFFS